MTKRISTSYGTQPLQKVTFVSVLVVIRNEWQHIEQCLQSLVDQDYPHDGYEIIVVDGMSADGTREIVSKFAQNHHNICLVNNPKGVKPAGLNIGIKESKGDIVVIVDGHGYVEEDFISKNVEYLEKTGAACVGGTWHTLGEGYIGGAIASALTSPFGVGNAKFRYSKEEGFVDTVPFGAYWKHIFDEVGLFNENRVRTEDIDLHSRIRKSGGKFLLTPEIKSYYYARSTLKDLTKQAFSNGYEVVTALYAVSIRHLVPLAFVSTLLLCLISAIFTQVGKILLAAIIGAYLAGAIIFSLKASLERGVKYIPILPVIFFIFHFSYGLGSIWSFVRRGKL